MERSYSILTIKGIADERREITGIATTPTPDRVGDIVVSKGIKFKNPLPLLLFHDQKRPVGTVKFHPATDDGIEFTASMPMVTEPGPLKDRIDEAWQSLKAGLIRGVSIGFRGLDDGVEFMKGGGIRWLKTEVLELSLVVVPANADARIETIKSLDADSLAASGLHSASGASDASRVVRITQAKTMKQTIAERKVAFVAEKAAKVAKLNELMNGEDAGVTLDAENQGAFDTLTEEIRSIDSHLSRLETLETVNKAAAVEVPAEPGRAAAVRSSIVAVPQKFAPGLEFAMAALVKANSFLTHRDPVQIVKERYSGVPRVVDYITKATIAAGTSVETTWAAPLVDTTTLEGEFLEYLRPMTIVGRMTGLRRVPFNVRIPRQTTGGTGYWVGEGAPKPMTKFDFDAITLPYHKAAVIAVITQELARFSRPSAEMIVRDQIAAAVVARLDTDIIDPDKALVSGVSPASLTNGVAALTSAGTSADNARTDVQNILEQFILNNVNPSGLVLIMPNTLALALSTMFTTLGTRQFPDLTMNGGTLLGIPVITSQYAANTGANGNMVIAVNQSDIFLADDGGISIDVSTEASLQFLDNPTNNSSTGTATSMVSLWQTNSIGLRAERFISWLKGRSTSVVWMDDVNWGSIGSPA